MTMDQTDLHALLGDEHDDVVERAAATLYGCNYGTPWPEKGHADRFHWMHDAAAVLAAVLPGLLAEAWNEGQRATLDKVTRFYRLSPHEAEFLMGKTPNPYG